MVYAQEWEAGDRVGTKQGCGDEGPTLSILNKEVRAGEMVSV